MKINIDLLKINKELLPLKLHFFLLNSALGPLAPYTVVLGKQLGASEVIMGAVNGVLPLLYLVIKPLAGYTMDYFPKRKSIIFTCCILIMAIVNSSVYFILPVYDSNQNITVNAEIRCQNQTFSFDLKDDCNNSKSTNADYQEGSKSSQGLSVSIMGFLILVSIGSILFNICNNYSDVICFDILGEENRMEYGKQKLWGAIGFGFTGFLTGFLIDIFSDNRFPHNKNHTPALILAFVVAMADVLISLKLKPPVQPHPSPNILGGVLKAFKNPKMTWFIFLAIILGMCNSFLLFFLFWYLEDIGIGTSSYMKIRSIEGVILLCQTFFGEAIFFNLSGYIIKKIGYNYSFVLCLVGYSIRFALLSVIPNIWWALPIEAIFHASFALSYAVIVSYTNCISSSGIHATMQSVSMTMFDGIGFALGSFLGGLSLQLVGGRNTFSLLSLLCFITAALTMMAIIYSNWRKKLNSGYQRFP